MKRKMTIGRPKKMVMHHVRMFLAEQRRVQRMARRFGMRQGELINKALLEWEDRHEP